MGPVKGIFGQSPTLRQNAPPTVPDIPWDQATSPGIFKRFARAITTRLIPCPVMGTVAFQDDAKD